MRAVAMGHYLAVDNIDPLCAALALPGNHTGRGIRALGYQH